MTATITKRVGKGRFRPRNDPDVAVVAELLEQVPVDQGGPGSGFRNSLTQNELEKAIANFQAYQFGQVTGFVDPDNITMRRLNRFADGGRPGVDAIAWQFKAQRKYVVQCAQSMVGKVSNAHIDPKTKERRGWRELWDIFHSAGIPVESESEYESRKALPKFTLPAGGKIPFDQFKYVKGTKPGGIPWCGIFATWALNQAGFNVMWRLNKGICEGNGTPLPVLSPHGVTIGDVCIVADTSEQVSVRDRGADIRFYEQFLSHHIIVASHPSPHGNIDVIEGNFPHQTQGAHSIVDDSNRMPKRKRHVREILQRYDLFQPVSM